MKKLIRKAINKLGYNIVPLKPVQSAPLAPRSPLTMDGMLKRSSLKKIEYATVIDVGASNGMWAKSCIRFYPDADYLLIEAQDVHLDGLNAFKKEHAKVDYVLAAAGNKEGEIYFDVSDPFGGLASETPVGDKYVTVKVTTIDIEVKKRNLKGPFLVKLDTHGFEVPILEGAQETLKHANGVIIEVYNFYLTKDSLLFYEMCAYMDKLGFRPLDIGDPYLRLYDESFWQMDVLFVPKSRKEFSYNEYK